MTKYETLSNSMHSQDRLKVACACGHTSHFNLGEALALFGQDATPYDIRRRLRCRRCHEVGKVTLSI
ncbi:hypothetical protein ASE17_19675 [Phenylobacterium sp. Root77]|jgi:hypothetical protein|nr:hypothetical protein ASC73_17930 [Phenylobacterium sp. Root1277]KQW89704.1 hypothetical protein ASC79_18835 [Phenylobacterium sp. Root1290]KRC43428.1 hypothetical protein ASE17_19675 [Phenylobacterium sp. Root77]